MNKFFITAFAGMTLSVLCLIGCQNDDITSVRVPKESQSSTQMSAMTMPKVDMPPTQQAQMPPSDNMPPLDNAAVSTEREIQWKVPAGWVEQAPSSMRVGSFLATGKNGLKADISVVPLSGEAGGDLANINRWRGQINLPPISEADLNKVREFISPGGRRMLFVNFVSDELLINNKYKKRLVAAIYQQGDRSWFFKMTGENQTVTEIKPAFIKFLGTIKFKNS